jgi:phosphoglycolate phosphatase
VSIWWTGAALTPEQPRRSAASPLPAGSSRYAPTRPRSLADRFAAITGQDTFGYRKPDPRHLIETIRVAGGDPARAVMVGDSETDVATAVAAQVPVIAVSFGYSARDVATLGANHVVDSFAEIWDAVASLGVDARPASATRGD